MKDWNYDDLYKKYDMEGNIEIGTGVVKVHDIFNPLPSFMKNADLIFSDPPCSTSNLNTFYTKADKPDERKSGFVDFENRVFECLDEINPKMVVFETFKSNKESFLEKTKQRYKYVNLYECTYYKKSRCYIIVGSNNPIEDLPFNGMDEHDIIEYICKNFKFDCIGDFCMGKGQVGFFANKYGRKFVGTELNKKRLAILLERINKGNFNYK